MSFDPGEVETAAGDPLAAVADPMTATTSWIADERGPATATISVVVPVYFNAGSLRLLTERLRAVGTQLSPRLLELIFVDDGSGDESFAVLSELAAADPRVKAIRLSRNFGSNAAILAGLAHATGDAIAVIAADLQDPPEMILELVARWEAGYDLVLAARGSRDDPFASRLFATIFNRLFRALVFPDFPRDGFDFMLLSRRVARLLVELGERNSYIFGQAMWVGFRRTVVTYDRERRESGRSRWTVRRKVKYLIDAFTAFSYLPVRAASLIGGIVAVLGFLYALLVIVLRLAGVITETGFSALMVVVLVLGGVQLLVVGMLGEYLWRVLEETRRRPPYIVDKTVNV